MYFAAKTLITALLVAAISELSKRYSFIAALLASLPLTSLLAFVWMYIDGAAPQKIGELSMSIFWLVIPSLALFLLLPWLLKMNVQFWLALLLSCAGTALLYGAGIMLWKYGFSGNS